MTRPRQIKHSVKHLHSNPKKLHKAAHRWSDQAKKDHQRATNYLGTIGIRNTCPRWRRTSKLYDDLEQHYINRYMNEHNVDIRNFNDNDFKKWMSWLKDNSQTVYKSINNRLGRR